MANEPREEQKAAADAAASPGSGEEQRTAAQSPVPSGPAGGKPPVAPDEPEARENDQQLTRSQWKERARWEFGVSPHAIEGALALRDPAEEMSKSQVRDALDKFSARKGVAE